MKKDNNKQEYAVTKTAKDKLYDESSETKKKTNTKNNSATATQLAPTDMGIERETHTHTHRLYAVHAGPLCWFNFLAFAIDEAEPCKVGCKKASQSSTGSTVRF